MIFAAGLGTRLRPITNDRPKAMVAINGMPLLEIAIRRLKWFGIEDIVINIHHFGQQILDFLASRHYFDCQITISDERNLLLDTGGGLKKAAPYLGSDSFVLYNVDILNDLDLDAMITAHQQTKALATLAVRQRSSSRYFLFDENNRLSGWRNAKTGARIDCRDVKNAQDWAFSGIHIVNPRLMDFMPEASVFSIIDVYLQAGQTESIMAYPHDNSLWLDVGKHEALPKAEALLPQIKIL